MQGRKKSDEGGRRRERWPDAADSNKSNNMLTVGRKHKRWMSREKMRRGERERKT